MLVEPNRNIVISQEINSELAKDVINQIIEINEFDRVREENLANYEREPIHIYINSGGGNVTDGFAIISAMEMSDTPIITYGMGIVASMALGIFVKGDVRIASPYCRFMYHSISYGVSGFIKDHEDAKKESNILQKMYNDLFKNTKITKAMMKDIRDKKIDYYFSSKKAQELGVVDYIMEEREKTIELVEEE